jgi:hypothetical protein
LIFDYPNHLVGNAISMQYKPSEKFADDGQTLTLDLLKICGSLDHLVRADGSDPAVKQTNRAGKPRPSII